MSEVNMDCLDGIFVDYNMNRKLKIQWDNDEQFWLSVIDTGKKNERVILDVRIDILTGKTRKCPTRSVS